VAALLLSPSNALSADHEPRPVSTGDWVGQLRIEADTHYVRIRFAADTVTGMRANVDLPLSNRWNVRMAVRIGDGGTLAAQLPLDGDTARIDAAVTSDSITGGVLLRGARGSLRLLHRIAYDSALVRPLAGNYAIADDRVISMGPMDEAGGWLSFFDSKTRRGGILYALNDSVFYTGPTFSIDYPVAIRATIQRSAGGAVRALRWEEVGERARDARRLDDVRQEDVSFDNAGVHLVGNVTSPKSPGRHPAVILIHGCCGTIPTRDFGYWSSYLAHHGIAVLAFDKRGGGQSTGNANTSSYEDFADDVLAGLAMLQRRSDIDSAKIGLYGMSNGGYIAPLAVARSGGRVAFVAVRAGSARAIGGNIDYEVGNDLRSEGFGESDVERGVAIRRRVTQFVIDHPVLTSASWDSLESEVAAVQNERWFGWSRTAWVPRVSPTDSGGKAYLDALRSAWKYDPVPYWAQLQIPIYIMLGALDRSVPSEETAKVLRSTFERSGNRDATVRVYPNANHGLLLAHNGYEREIKSLSYYVPDFQGSLVRWIREHTSGNPAKRRMGETAP
jgi:dienelactone hydrolase